MSITTITRVNYDDQSDEHGYRFLFRCDKCNAGFRSNYVEADSNKKRDFIEIATKTISLSTEIIDAIPIGGKPDLSETSSKQEELADTISHRYESMSPEWQRGYDETLKAAQEEIKKFFKNCPACGRWVCAKDWNTQKQLCNDDSLQRRCPNCNEVVDSVKFCTQCGHSLQLTCPKCRAVASADREFCGECGTRLMKQNAARKKESKRPKKKDMG